MNFLSKVQLTQICKALILVVKLLRLKKNWEKYKKIVRMNEFLVPLLPLNNLKVK
jgi:hypothetical protein